MTTRFGGGMESKLHLYNRMMATRNELKPEFVALASIEIERRILIMEEFRTALRVGLYAAFGNEVRTEMLFQEGDKHRKEIYYPAAHPSGKGLAYFRVTRPEELLCNENGMMEPTAKQSKLRDLNTLNVLIVPAVAVDLNGSRMGFGKGFYENSLENFRGRRIALVYDFQVVSEFPAGSRGRKLDWIVTEKRIIKP